MDFILYLLALVVTGLVVGALARLALPGRDPMTIGQTILVGIGGAIVAGLIARLVFDSDGAGILLSVLCATVIVYVVRRTRGGSLTEPAPRSRMHRPTT